MHQSRYGIPALRADLQHFSENARIEIKDEKKRHAGNKHNIDQRLPVSHVDGEVFGFDLDRAFCGCGGAILTDHSKSVQGR